MRALVLIVLLLSLTPLTAQAYHEACPASFANLTVRVLDGGFYAVLEEGGVALFEETNAHSGLQRGALPAGCEPDARIY